MDDFVCQVPNCLMNPAVPAIRILTIIHAFFKDFKIKSHQDIIQGLSHTSGKKSPRSFLVICHQY